MIHTSPIKSSNIETNYSPRKSPLKSPQKSPQKQEEVTARFLQENDAIISEITEHFYEVYHERIKKHEIENAVFVDYYTLILPRMQMNYMKCDKHAPIYEKIKKMDKLTNNRVRFDIVYVLDSHSKKFIFNTKQPLGKGHYNGICSTVTLQIFKGKTDVEVAKGIQRKSVEIYDAMQTQNITHTLSKVRNIFQNIQHIHLPSLPFFRDKGNELSRAVTYEEYLGVDLCTAASHLSNEEKIKTFRPLIYTLFKMRASNNVHEIIIHGDIKPENIIVKQDEEGEVISSILIDVDGAAKGSNPLYCSKGYILPSTLSLQKKQMFDVNQDIFALALSLFQVAHTAEANDFIDALEEINKSLAEKIRSTTLDSKIDSATQQANVLLNEALRQHVKNDHYFQLFKKLKDLNPDDIEGGSHCLCSMQALLESFKKRKRSLSSLFRHPTE